MAIDTDPPSEAGRRSARVGIISDPPFFTTGLGTTGRRIADALHAAGHTVTYLGLWTTGKERYDGSRFPYRICAGVAPLGHSVAQFLKTERPDVLLLNIDVRTSAQLYDGCRKLGWGGPVVAHVVVDGLPAYVDDLRFLSQLRGTIAPTRATADYLAAAGAAGVVYAPHGVDRDVFRPLPHRADLRRAAGLNGRFVVGVFGRNSERKQHPRVLMALARLKAAGDAEGVSLYLHCQPVDDPGFNGWNLTRVAEQLGVAGAVTFPGDGFLNTSGVPYTRDPGAAGGPAQGYSYVERLNCCDLVVNSAFCGGFELNTLEAQACGVPVAVTDDGGNMAEVVGDGGLLLPPVDVGVWRGGGRQHLVSADTIAAAVRRVRNEPGLREALVARGLANAARYPWSRLTEAAVAVVDRALAPTPG